MDFEKENQDCVICAEKYTKIQRKPVSCPKCNYESCINCLRRHCLDGNDAMCMNPDCRSIFPTTFLYETFPMAFMKGEFRKHQADLCMNKEKALLQATMPYVEAKIKKDEAKKDLETLVKEQRILLQKIYEVKYKIRGYESQAGEIEQKERKAFIKKCQTEGCNGFLNNSYNCSICKTSFCGRCFELKEENHVCDEDILKTAQLLKKDTKSCPNCNEMIHKIEGCDQMYCTKCHTGFSWKTGKIVTGIVHNPHYFQYHRDIGDLNRAIGDIPCGGIPNIEFFKRKICETLNLEMKNFNNIISLYRYNQLTPATKNNEHYVNGKNLFRKIMNWIQIASHVRDIEIPMNDEGTNFNKNLEKRIDFLMNNCTEKEFKDYCIKKETSWVKKREILQIYTTFATLIEDQLRNIIAEQVEKISEVDLILQECIHILDYINNCFKNLSKTLKKTVPQIHLPADMTNNNSRIHINRSSGPYSNFP